MTWKKVRRNSIRRIQHYRHNYCLLSLTGCLGCRWKRYKQSKQAETPCDHIWSLTLVLTFSLSSLFLYCWLVGVNEHYYLNNALFSWLNDWVNWYIVMRSLILGIYCYICFIVILSLLHICLGYQLYIHHVHRVLLVLVFVIVFALLSLVLQFFGEFWSLMLISVKIFGPYLQLCFVLLFTLLSWLAADKIWRTESIAWRVTLMGLFVCVMSVVYLSPLMTFYPCICAKSQLPPKPRIIAHRGAASMAAENTLSAFELSMTYNASVVAVDLAVSADGFIYAFHDVNLLRTTDVATIFPDNVTSPFYHFTSDEIDRLDAGAWFPTRDPFGTASSSVLSDARAISRSLPVPRFLHVLERVRQHNVSVIFDVETSYQRLPAQHPYRDYFRQAVIDDIYTSGISLDKVYWIEQFNHSLPTPVGTRPVLKSHCVICRPGTDTWSDVTADVVKDWQVRTLSVTNAHLTEGQLRLYARHDIDLFIYLVDADWLLSYYWCVGVSAVYTNRAVEFSTIQAPYYTMEPRSYLLSWILADFISVAIVTMIFLIQYLRRTTGCFLPQVAMRGTRRSQMREKLLYVVDRCHQKSGIDHRIETDQETFRPNVSLESLDVQSLEHVAAMTAPRPYCHDTASITTSLDHCDAMSKSGVAVIVDKY